jgi:ABC-type polysaccharide/polyol phosphate export permease
MSNIIKRIIEFILYILYIMIINPIVVIIEIFRWILTGENKYYEISEYLYDLMIKILYKNE